MEAISGDDKGRPENFSPHFYDEVPVLKGNSPQEGVGEAGKFFGSGVDGKIDVYDKEVGKLERARSGRKGDIFLKALLLDEGSKLNFAPFKFEKYYFETGKGVYKPCRIRSLLLDYIRKIGKEKRFLEAIARCRRVDIVDIYYKLLDRHKIYGSKRQEMVKTLVEETEWVALALVKDLVREKALGEIDIARDCVKMILEDKDKLNRLSSVVLKTKDVTFLRQYLSISGMDEESAEKIKRAVSKGDLDSVRSAITNHVKLLEKKLDKFYTEISLMGRFSKFRISDFKPVVDSVLEEIGCYNPRGTYLMTLVGRMVNGDDNSKFIEAGFKAAVGVFSSLALGMICAEAAAASVAVKVVARTVNLVASGTMGFVSYRDDDDRVRMLKMLNEGGLVYDQDVKIATIVKASDIFFSILSGICP